jgi:hypothetical protein
MLSCVPLLHALLLLFFGLQELYPQHQQHYSSLPVQVNIPATTAAATKAQCQSKRQ